MRLQNKAAANAPIRPGAEVEIRSSGDERGGITVVISNPLRDRPSAAPGAGQGLVGLRERAAAGA